MSFLVSVLASVIEWLLQKVFAIVGKDLDIYRQHQADIKQATEDAQKLKDAQSDQDKADAARNIADHTF